jgi:DMSO/TMAO reductase YedYZ molybdopterin-dependent catalytic subunit
MAGQKIESANLKRPSPPGQTYVDTFPIYDITPRRPTFDASKWRFRVWGAVENRLEMTWEELMSLPAVEVVADFHCVTKWSKKALTWEGIPTREILKLVGPAKDVVQVMAHCMEGYTTNVPVEYFAMEDSLLAFKMNGEPLTPEHGAPLRLVVPQLYAWKSAKYLEGLEFQKDWKPGFWEERGYHLIGDPWEEQRYWEPIERVREWWRKVRVTKVERPREDSGP